MTIAACLSPLARVGAAQQAAARPTAVPPGGDIDTRRFDAIAPLVTEAIADRKLPGAVVLVGRGDRVLYQQAIGHRALVPAAEPMTLDTMFDVASLTKVVATTTAVMMLLEQGRIRLNDRVSTFIPGFQRYGKE